MQQQLNIVKDVYKNVKISGQGAINIVDLTSHATQDPVTTILAFPPAGGIASIYANLGQRLKNCRLLAVDLPGHLLTKGELFDEYESLCDFLFENIPAEIFKVTSLVLLGTSFGGYLICGLAKRLIQTYGYYPKLIILSTPPPSALSMLADFDSMTTEMLFDRLIESKETISEILSNNELKLQFVKILRADLKIFCSFCFPEEIRSCDALLIAGLKDRSIKPDVFYAWSEYFTNCSIDFVNGGHLFISDDHCRDVAYMMSDHGFIDFTSTD